jgi:hypothetical protein
MHIHVGILHAIGVFLSVVIIGFFWRIVAGMNADNPVGQAMSFIY